MKTDLEYALRELVAADRRYALAKQRFDEANDELTAARNALHTFEKKVVGLVDLPEGASQDGVEVFLSAFGQFFKVRKRGEGGSATVLEVQE